MKPEIKVKWVAALRSGEYKQTTGYLEKNGYHCCLGVLCEISKLETGFGVKETIIEGCGIHLLSDTVIRWSGLDTESGSRVVIDGDDTMLADHNDDGRTFLEIADAIEEQL